MSMLNMDSVAIPFGDINWELPKFIWWELPNSVKRIFAVANPFGAINWVLETHVELPKGNTVYS